LSSKEKDGENGVTLLLETTPDFYKEDGEAKGKVSIRIIEAAPLQRISVKKISV